MALEFQQLGGVELLSTMPEESTIVAEVGGKIKRIPGNYAESYFDTKLANAELLEDIFENSNVLIETNGDFQRVPGDLFFGGAAEGMIVNFTVNTSDNSITADKTYQEVYDAIMAGTTVYGKLSVPLSDTATITYTLNASIFSNPEMGTVIFYMINGRTIVQIMLFSDNTVDTNNMQIPDISSSVTSGSALAVSSGAVYTALEAKQDKITDSVIISSSTSGSTKQFKITVDDSGTITATEVVAES